MKNTLISVLFVALFALAAPASAQVVETRQFALGTRIKLTVTAKGTQPFTYQWAKDGVVISGATAADYTITGLAAKDVGTYAATVKNEAGETVGSMRVIVEIIAPSDGQVVSYPEGKKK